MNMENEKLLGGAVEISLFEDFDKQVSALKFKKKQVIKALVMLWINLPEEEQKRLYGQAGLSENLEDILEKIIQSKIINNGRFVNRSEYEALLMSVKKIAKKLLPIETLTGVIVS